jgi:hypothetical protein
MKKIFLLSALSLLLNLNLKSQNCGTCTYSFNDSDTSTVVVAAGQTLCIDSMAIFIGKVTMNGGTLCVKGIFNPNTFVFNSGTVTNYGNMTLNPASLTFGSGTTLSNKADAMLNIKGNLILSGTTFSNLGIINVGQNINATSGTLSNNSIINCTTLTGATNIANQGTINTN